MGSLKLQEEVDSWHLSFSLLPAHLALDTQGTRTHGKCQNYVYSGNSPSSKGKRNAYPIYIHRSVNTQKTLCFYLVLYVANDSEWPLPRYSRFYK